MIVALSIILSACAFIEPNPETAVSEGFQKMFGLKRTSFSLSFAAKDLMAASFAEDDVFSVELSGKSDSEDEENPKFDGQGTVSINSKETALKIALDLRLFGKKLYLNLTNTELPEAAETFKQSLAALQGKWWMMENPAESSPYLKSLTEEQKQLAEALKNIPIFTEPVKISEEAVNGLLSRKYKIALSRPGLKQFILMFAKLGGNEVSETEAAAIEESLKDITFDGHVWVAKKGGVMNRIAGKLTMQDAPSFDIDVQMWDFGKKFSIEEPKDATPFNPAQLFGGLGFPALPDRSFDDSSDGSEEALPIDQPLGAEQAE